MLDKWTVGVRTLRYIIDNDKTYIDDIVKHLVDHNKSCIGEKKNIKHHFYKTSQDELVAGMNTHMFWDWVSIIDLKYDTLESLKELIDSACITYKGDAVGIRFNSSFTTIVNDLQKIGFIEKGCIKYSPIMNHYHYLELRSLENSTDVIDEIIVQEEVDNSFNKIMETETVRLKEQYNVSSSTSDICIIALDENTFAGGIVGNLFEDHMYIDMLVVNKEYRNQNIGSNLILRIEEELNENIVTISLGTAEFQARSFYEKCGYNTIMTQTDFPKGFECYTLVKDITPTKFIIK